MSISSLYLKLVVAFFFLMLIFPTMYQMERAVLLAVLTAGGLVYALEGRWRISRTIFLWLLVTLAAGLLFMWNGIRLGSPGALQLSTVYVIWPLLYVFFIGLLSRVETLVTLEKTIICGGLVSALMGIFLVVSTFTGYAEQLTELLNSQDVDVGLYDGFTRYRLPNIATLVYGAGFLLSFVTYSSQDNTYNTRGWRLVAWLTLAVVIIAIVLSGRRAAWLILLIVPAVVFGMMIVAHQPLRMRYWLKLSLLVVLAFIAVHAYFDLQLSTLTHVFFSAFDVDAGESAWARSMQYDALLSGWIERPFLGHGLGAVTHVVRSSEQLWAYELTYMALLFQTGLIGVVIYASGVWWIFWKGIITVRRFPESAVVILPLLCGLVGFLIANGTNPYLAKFDYLWVIFLPLAAIHVYTIRTSRL